jgi:adenosine kinase
LHPERLEALSVAFGVAAPHTRYGGTAGNIAYNAALLGESPLLLGNVGEDFEREGYGAHLRQCHLDPSTLAWNPGPTARAWLLGDCTGSQITAFHKGALAHPVRVHPAAFEAVVWHLAPEDPDNMMALAELARRRGVPYFFDPGQALPGILERDAAHPQAGMLASILRHAAGVFVNEYEDALLQRHITHAQRPQDFAFALQGFWVRTLGAQGAALLDARSGQEWIVPACKPAQAVDATGCGDALRAGFLYGHLKGLGLEASLRLGSALASFAVEQHGGQAHNPDIYAVVARAST